MKDICGYEGIYKIDKNGNIFSIKANKFISPFFSKGRKGENKYLRIQLRKDGKCKKYFVHRLVALLFISNNKSNEKIMVNHKDGNKTNNHFSNLEWVTPSENNIHAVKNGLAKGYNGTKQKRNTSGYVGVTKAGSRWKSQIRVNNKLIYLGVYKTKEEASEKYNNYLAESIKKKV